MAGRKTSTLGRRNSLAKLQNRIKENLDYHEGLSFNQVQIILTELGLGDRIKQFGKWMDGQTCTVIRRWDAATNDYEPVGGIYEYDLFRWIDSQKKRVPLVWD